MDREIHLTIIVLETRLHLTLLDSRHFGLSNGPNGLEKLHRGAKLPPRYFWQPELKKNVLSFF